MLSELGCTVHTQYVRSASNPADEPSRGIYGSQALLLPPVRLDGYLSEFLVDFNDPVGNTFPAVHTHHKQISAEEQQRREDCTVDLANDTSALINAARSW